MLRLTSVSTTDKGVMENVTQKIIGPGWNRQNLDSINDNFTELYGYKSTADNAKATSKQAEEKAENALETAKQANTTADSVKEQLDNIILENGNSEAEVVQSRTNADGKTFTVLNDRLNDSDSKLAGKALKNKLYRKSVFKKLPLRFPDYDSIVSQEGVSYIYPQSFTIDWDNNEIFILYSPNEQATSTKRWVVVYDLNTKAYKVCFHAGDSGGEGIVVKTEGADRYLYVKTTGFSLGKFLITTLPANKSDLTPVTSYDIGLYYDFSYRDGLWLIEQGGAPIGNIVTRTHFKYYDDNFNQIGSIDITPETGGYFNTDYSNYIPKRQGIALGDGYIVQGAGGFYGQNNAIIPYAYQGIKILNMDGSLKEEGVVDPSQLINQLNSIGIKANRIETEGVHVSPNEDIYSLVVTNGSTSDIITLSEGIVIFKEQSEDKDSLNLKPYALNYPKLSRQTVENGVFPRATDGNMYDPYKGTVMDTLDKILDFMIGVSLKQFRFYSSSVSVADINGVTIPGSNLITIRNANNGMFMVDYFSNVSTCKTFTIYGSSGSRTQKRVYAGEASVNLTLQSGVTPYYSGADPYVKRLADGSVMVDGYVNIPTTRPFTIAILPQEYRPSSRKTFVVALSASTSGGYGVIQITEIGEIKVVYTSASVTYISLAGIIYNH